jgi:hypothetical protein
MKSFLFLLYFCPFFEVIRTVARKTCFLFKSPIAVLYLRRPETLAILKDKSLNFEYAASCRIFNGSVATNFMYFDAVNRKKCN